jgi:beta-lactamase superfamily II metal-dependent hydrolase
MTDHRDEHETYGHTHSPVIEDLRKQVATLLDEQTGFRVAISNLTAERDEARREVCQWEHHWDKTSSEQYYADKRGWDCFKEDGK